MSTCNKTLILNLMREQGKTDALDLRSRAPEMDGTAIIAEESKVPAFDPEKDYSEWPVGAPVADGGQVWLLLQPHNAADCSGRPADLRALWSLAHTTDPAKAKPWVESFGTSGLYKLGEVCAHNGHIWRNLYDNNEYPPQTLNAEDRWEDLGEV